ncbi:GPP34 family phosphoprotein [Agrococcus sp. ARC_14]|uniref:GOLPH3/VPS74 family protein n=1 Tax=Agrococcus sp. ARC_14 TaxID=2919927 RepID=UPI001F05C84A|nr:GPP34 family phosphoprotein [Agrococcus sp. ARC_14]MCH1881937.1 GPP34 family phosphoprotein [Agrococcus sp. ARC_14]
MTTEPQEPTPGAEPDPSDPAPQQREPMLAEDLMLLLFQPDAGLQQGVGAIAGENILFYVLGGAVLTELALGGHVRTDDGARAARVETTEIAPADPLLRSAWDYIAQKPRGVQTVLAAIGPTLRTPVLARLIERGDIREGTRKTLGLFQTTVLEGDGGERRATLMAQVRAVLVDGAEPSPRIAALAALFSGSGTMPQFYREIPWTSPVIARAKELEQGDWGAGAAAAAVARTMTATIVSNVVVAAAVLPRS